MCDFSCKTFDELLDHMNSYHPDSTDFTKCVDCDKEYDSYKKLSKGVSFSYFFPGGDEYNAIFSRWGKLKLLVFYFKKKTRHFMCLKN